MNKFTISDPVKFVGTDKNGNEIWQVYIIKDRLIYSPNGEGATESTREKAIQEATKTINRLNNE